MLLLSALDIFRTPCLWIFISLRTSTSRVPHRWVGESCFQMLGSYTWTDPRFQPWASESVLEDRLDLSIIPPPSSRATSSCMACGGAHIHRWNE